MSLVFQYGSNASSKRLNVKDRLNGKARFEMIAYTEDNYELEFTIWSSKNDCAAAHIRRCDSGRKIWGVLYKIPWCRIKRDASGLCRTLDSIEGEGVNYHRTTIALRDQNGRAIKREVLTYFGKKIKQRIKTNLEYPKYIITGLREHSVPEEYIEYVKTRVIENNPSLRIDINAI